MRILWHATDCSNYTQDSIDVILQQTNRNGKVITTVQLNCLNPQITFESLNKLWYRSMVLTSGTLSPMKLIEEELGIKFELMVSVPHFFDLKKQIRATIIRGKS